MNWQYNVVSFVGGGDHNANRCAIADPRMPIFRPELIVNYTDVPVECPHCGYTDSSATRTKTSKLALVTTTRYHRTVTELALLHRTKQLFDRFPDSRHSAIVDKLHLKDAPCDDAAFDAALDADPDLRDFLQPRHGFYLPARLAYASEQAATIPPEITRKEIQCPDCSKYLVLPEDFFIMIGLSRRTT